MYYKKGSSAFNKYIYYGMVSHISGNAWIIASNITTNYKSMDAYCPQATSVPSSCSTWYSYSSGTVKTDSSIVFGDSYCDSTNYICIASDSLSTSMEGTYRQVINNVAVWAHEEFDYQNASSYIVYGNYSEMTQENFNEYKYSTKYGFQLISSGTVYARCEMDTKYNYTASLLLGSCSQWEVLQEQEFGPQNYMFDSTFTVGTKWCPGFFSSGEGNYTSIICMDQTLELNYTYYSAFNYIWGEFELLPNQYHDDEPIYYNTRLNNTDYSLYIIYSLWDDSWMLYDHIPTSSNTPLYDSIATCTRDNVDAPYDCSSCWGFNFMLGDLPCVVTVNEGNCNRSYNANDAYPTAFCVSTIDLMLDEIGYYQYSFVNLTNGRPFWLADNTHYIYYSTLLRSWILYQNMTEIFCYDYGTNDISNCSWSDPDIIFSSICNVSVSLPIITTKFTVIPPAKDTSSSSNVKTIIGWTVGVCVLVLIMILAVFYFWKKSKKRTQYTEFDHHDIAAVKIEANPVSTVTPGNAEGTEVNLQPFVSNNNEKDGNETTSNKNEDQVWQRYDE